MENEEIQEILEEYQKKYNRYHKWAKRVFLCGAAIILLQLGFDAVTVLNNKKLYNTPKYTSKEALSADFEQEKRKLGLEAKTMYLEIIPKPSFIGACSLDPNDTYKIKIGENYMAQGILRHEMFHAKRIKEGKLRPSKIRLYLKRDYEEWLATSYGLKKDN